jgi:hypothetical protein
MGKVKLVGFDIETQNTWISLEGSGEWLNEVIRDVKSMEKCPEGCLFIWAEVKTGLQETE